MSSVPVIKSPSLTGSIYTASNHHGAVIPHVSLQLIFWGKDWPNQPLGPSADEITAAVQNLLNGPYMSGLIQYGIALGSLRGTTYYKFDPPKPFSQGDWHTLIWRLIVDGQFPYPDEPGGRNLYMFVMPPNFGYNDPNVAGAHGPVWQFDAPADVDIAWVGFVLNQGDVNNKDSFMTNLMINMSHEIAEACTDPEAQWSDAWTIDGQTHSSYPGCEICDVCTNQKNSVDGVPVQGYWSNFDQACIIPTAFSLRRYLLMKGLDPTKGLRGIQPPVKSVRQMIIAG